MGVLDQKQQIFGNIAAARSLTEGLPTLNANSSFPSINNDGDSISFLTDLIKALVGFQELQKTIETIISTNLIEIEREIKIALKSQLKSIVSCNVNPSIPDWLKYGNVGAKFKVSQVDFVNLMFVNPTSDAGKLLYNNIKSNLIDSTDFNTFLYQTIQNNGTVEGWGHQTMGDDILNFKYTAKDISNTDPNNTITVNASKYYTNNKTLTDLNNDYIDSVNLLNAPKLITNLIDNIFGTVSSTLNKSLTQLNKEAQITTVVNNLTKAKSNDVINSSYFQFNSSQISAQEANALQRRNGQSLVTTSSQIQTSVPFSSLQTMNTNVSSATNPLETRNAVSSSLNSIGNDLGSLATNPIDANTIKLNFIQSLIDNLIKCIVDTILSPKIVSLFLLNYKIINGPTATFTDVIDFMEKNKNLLYNVIKGISASIIKVLLKFALGEIGKLVTASVGKKSLDKNNLYIAQLLTLVGVPPSIIQLINKLV
jgi:hypothetical protein